MISLNNKKILIFGASGFIGEQTAITLSRLGAKLILSGRKLNRLQDVLKKLDGTGHKLFEFDVSSIKDIQGFVKSIVDMDNEKIYGLVYCAGIYPIMPLKNTTYDFLHNMMLVNYYSFVETVRCFSHRKVSSGGSVVVLSSYASQNGDKGRLAYSASKGAIDSSVVVMAKELFAKNIRVNAIRPAALLQENALFEDLPTGIQKSINDMKTGPISPKNIAEHIAFLLSESSSGVTGRCFDVRGYLS